MKLVDIGVNLTSTQFGNDRSEVVRNAVQAGVHKMIVTGTNLYHSQEAQKLSLAYPNVLYSTAGMHPHHANDFDDAAIQAIVDLLQLPGVVAVGECGLDFNRNYSSRENQLSCYQAQLEIAVASGQPVFLHERDAHDDFLKILAKYRNQLTNAVVHCFTGTASELEKYLDYDLHIGITGWICDERRGKELQSLVSAIPVNRLMIETDAPYLLPRNLNPKPKDKRNEPRYLPHLCATIAACMSIDPITLAEATSKTAVKFFRLEK